MLLWICMTSIKILMHLLYGIFSLNFHQNFSETLSLKNTEMRNLYYKFELTQFLGLYLCIRIFNEESLLEVNTLAQIFISKKLAIDIFNFWFRENFWLPVFDGFTCLRMS